jgi:hypothetical protein
MAYADTVYLNDGRQIHGEIISTNISGDVRIKIGNSTFTYKADRVLKTEKNTRDAKIDIEAARKRVAEIQKKLTEETGLSQEVRAEIDDLLEGLMRSDYGRRMQSYERLKAIHEKHQIMVYLNDMLPSVSHLIAPWMLEAMFYIDKKAMKDTVVAYATDSFYGNRAMALQLLTAYEDVDGIQYISRGLKDHHRDVVISALGSITRVGGARDYTPAILQLLNNPNMRIQFAATDALKAIWFAETEEGVPANQNEWNAWWGENSGKVPGAKSLDSIEPLIAPEDEFVHG